MTVQQDFEAEREEAWRRSRYYNTLLYPASEKQREPFFAGYQAAAARYMPKERVEIKDLKEAAITKMVEHAMHISLSGDYQWREYMNDLYQIAQNSYGGIEKIALLEGMLAGKQLVIEQLERQLPKQGEVIVPVEPTEAMIKCGRTSNDDYGLKLAEACYRAMISAYKREGAE